MPKYIKTRNSAKNIKILNKSASLSARMKNGLARTKDKAEKTQTMRHASPAAYASENMQDTAQSTARTVIHAKSPRQKALQNLNRAKGHFQEVKRQLPQKRQRAAAQAKQVAKVTKTNAIKLRTTANQSSDTAQRAKSALNEAKQKLLQTRQAGRQAIREAKRSAKAPQSGGVPTPANAIPAQSISTHPAYSSAVPKVEIGTAKAAKPTGKAARNSAKGSVKAAKKTVKTAEQAAKSAVKAARQNAKMAQHSASTAIRAAKAAERAASSAARTANTMAKAAKRAVAATVKAAIAATKGLVAALAAGGWLAVLIVMFICMIGLLVSSMFGIFFSGEPSTSGMTTNSVIAEIDSEYTARIDKIISANPHDLLDMSGARALWKHVLAVYAVKTTTDPAHPLEVATMDDEKVAILRSVFWEVNTISHSLNAVEVEEDVLGDDGLPTGETVAVTKIVLRITVTHKTPAEMATRYGFAAGQIAQLDELLLPDYHYLWNALLYGITALGDGSLLEVADTQMGNIGGEPYWGWYGFEERVEWCACFVSWVAKQCGFIDAGIIPLFALCDDGIRWFKNRNQWQDNSYIPNSGDLIFFDWDGDGSSNHVGIVERVEDGRVYTIEGNTSDSVARRSYELGSAKIVGYGVPGY